MEFLINDQEEKKQTLAKFLRRHRVSMEILPKHLKLTYQGRTITIERREPDRQPDLNNEMGWLLMYAERVTWAEEKSLRNWSHEDRYKNADEAWRAKVVLDTAYSYWLSEYREGFNNKGNSELFHYYREERDKLKELFGNEYPELFTCSNEDYY